MARKSRPRTDFLLIEASAAKKVRDVIGLIDPELLSDEELTIEQIGNETDIQVIIEQCLEYADNRQSAADACRERAKKLTKRAERLEFTANRIKDLILRSLREAGIDRMPLSTETIGIAAAQPKLVISDDVDLEWIDRRYVEIKKTAAIDKSAVRAALERGARLDFAHLEPSTYLRRT